MSWRWAAAVSVALLLVVSPGLGAAGEPSRSRPLAVVAVVGETGVDALHPEYRTRDGKDVALPADIARRVVRVALPSRGSREAREAALARSALARPRVGTLYYVSGTRLLVYYATPKHTTGRQDAFHGTGTSSLAVGRTVGRAPESLAVAVVGYPQDSWTWVAAQRWIDVASASTFDALTGLLCDSAAAVARFRRSGHLPFVAAGNSFIETSVISPGSSPHAVRVGGVRSDGTSALPDSSDPTLYSGRAYDVGGLFTNRIARAGSDGFTTATGTSGSAPQVAGAAADVLARLREAVGARDVGARGGALVRISVRPDRGPLADGALTADELLEVVLHQAVPRGTQPAGRYAVEGYGWFTHSAADRAVAVLLGRQVDRTRPEDDLAHQAAVAARGAVAEAKQCERLPF